MKRWPKAIAVALLGGALIACGGGAEHPATSLLEARAREIVTDIASENFTGVRARFNDEMAAALSEDMLRRAWAQFQGFFGKFEAIQGIETIDRADVTVVNVALTMTLGEAQARVTFDSHGRVAGLWFLRPGVGLP